MTPAPAAAPDTRPTVRADQSPRQTSRTALPTGQTAQMPTRQPAQAVPPQAPRAASPTPRRLAPAAARWTSRWGRELLSRPLRPLLATTWRRNCRPHPARRRSRQRGGARSPPRGQRLVLRRRKRHHLCRPAHRPPMSSRVPARPTQLAAPFRRGPRRARRRHRQTARKTRRRHPEPTRRPSTGGRARLRSPCRRRFQPALAPRLYRLHRLHRGLPDRRRSP